MIRRVGVKQGSSQDEVIGEEPLEIRVEQELTTTSVFVVMRTPGQDFDLVPGWLFHEGLISSSTDIVTMRYCTDEEIVESERFNIVLVRLRNPMQVMPMSRTTFASSACGVCGTSGLEQLQLRYSPITDDLEVDQGVIMTLVESMAAQQRLFMKTGGVHSAALFDERGAILSVREDIGRHNALDKVVGDRLLNGGLETAKILVVSGRVGFEIIQKAVVSRLPIVASVSAPSSLSVEIARSFGITLIGFLRDGSFNIYSAPSRIRLH